MVSVSWAPQACTLPVAQQQLRVAEFDVLFAAAVHRVARWGPRRLWLQLRACVDTASVARELVARETQCCPFFEFTVGEQDQEVLLDVRVPETGCGVLDGLEARARAAVTGGAGR